MRASTYTTYLPSPSFSSLVPPHSPPTISSRRAPKSTFIKREFDIGQLSVSGTGGEGRREAPVLIYLFIYSHSNFPTSTIEDLTLVLSEVTPPRDSSDPSALFIVSGRILSLILLHFIRLRSCCGQGMVY
ncbi:hypothetical protein Pmani_032364 [Petrolisthes manimaculis]|uniref:Uncharacterized protein n=1 Tax=Petrolisthes manimaculis TaxID=1843537 RepID=A0AAE1NTX1_9EUCA|nr:hypothetical protein Pmani_032364 [Petrolisthes manimaculis]